MSPKILFIVISFFFVVFVFGRGPALCVASGRPERLYVVGRVRPVFSNFMRLGEACFCAAARGGRASFPGFAEREADSVYRMRGVLRGENMEGSGSPGAFHIGMTKY